MIKMSPDLKKRFPDLRILTFSVKDVKISQRNNELEKLKKTILKEVRERYNLESLKNISIFRAYRDFFWRIGVDPTKSRPAAEALIRRVLAEKPIPTINTLVDSYNFASIKSGVALAAFNKDKLNGELTMRLAFKNERFLGIGMNKPLYLNGSEVVVSDFKRLIALYPYRDADYSKVTEETKDVLMFVCGVPGILSETLTFARQVTLEYFRSFCNARTSTMRL